jgi:hypothetical protein
MQTSEQFIQDALSALVGRKRSDFRIGHVYRNESGYHLLDLDLSASSLDELQAAMLVKLASMKPEDELTPAPESAWRAFLEAPFAESRTFPSAFGKRGVIGMFARRAR